MRRLLTILLLTVASTAKAAENNQLFILDASGSMWGQIEGTPKITVAKEVMSGLVADLPADSKTGLLVYGHRRKGDCADIESLVGLGPLDRETMIERIQGLNPKGKTPITEAVKQAVEQLRQLEESASVVLVSDGLESCGGDPCEAVRAARESGVDFRLHVVGFDLGDADPAQLQCMAEAGGGEYYTAANAEELTGALEAAVAVKPGLVLEVTSNGERTPAWVYVHESGDDAVLVRDKLGDSPEGHDRNPLRIPLDPGTYDIRVAPIELDTDPEKTLTGLEIPEEGEIERSVDFSDGRLRLDITANGERKRARIDIYRAGTEERVVYENTYRKPEPIRLPPGDYDVQVTPKRLEAPAQWVRGINLTAGQAVTKEVDFSIGALKLDITANDERERARIDIYRAGTEERVVYENTYRKPEPIRLPPGDYDVRVTPKRLEVPAQWIRGISLGAGEAVTKEVDFAVGAIRLDVTANEERERARIDVYRAGTEERVVYENTYRKPEPFLLPPGDYDVRVTPKRLEAPAQWVRGINLSAGEVVTKEVDFAVGAIRLDITANGDRERARIDIYRAGTEERVVYENTYRKPEPFFLPSGDYDVRVTPKRIDEPARWLRGINLSAGEVVTKKIDFSEPSSTGTEASSSKSQDESGTGSASSGKTQAPVNIPVTSRSRFGEAFDLDSLGRGLQGTWVEYYGAPASRKVWHVQGDRFELYEVDLEEGKVEKKTMQLELFAPCAINLVIEDESTGMRSAQSVKVALGEEKSFADTAVAVETDGGVFACTGLEYYELDDSGCTKWEWDRLDDAWQSSSAECRIEDDKLVVGDTTLQKVGDIYAEDTSERYRLKRFESLEKARAKLQQ